MQRSASGKYGAQRRQPLLLPTVSLLQGRLQLARQTPQSRCSARHQLTHREKQVSLRSGRLVATAAAALAASLLLAAAAAAALVHRLLSPPVFISQPAAVQSSQVNRGCSDVAASCTVSRQSPAGLMVSPAPALLHVI